MTYLRITPYVEELIVLEFELEENNHRQLVSMLERYSRPGPVMDNISWVEYRVQNCMKRIFAGSEWKRAVNMLTQHEKNKFFWGLSEQQRVACAHCFPRKWIEGGSNLVMQLFLRANEKQVSNEEEFDVIQSEMRFEERVVRFQLELELAEVRRNWVVG